MKNVLLVEDDKFLSTLLKNRLEKEGLNVMYAQDGEKALEILRSGEKLDLVLLDVILPKKNGFEVLEEMQQDPRFKDVPTIIISNLGQDSDVARGKDLGAIEYYIKAQTSIDDLVVQIKNFVGVA
ncbi:MAG: response regulator [Candidatus Colwellbacteria bacterium]|jgi:DNA-binding response OmpR family regulator|nr:response regulator [Candidatus Colwellbacteria bacterium]MCK9497675.1 response regulator [Candidatus Colwellbacteria bacterium]